jgi:hypothetical protein
MKHPCMSFVFGVLVAVSLAGCKPPPARLAESVQVARACLQLMSSSLTNEVKIMPDDPRLPDVIRSLRPHDIEISGQTVVAIFPLHKGVTEYHFTPVASDTNMWQLSAAGPKFNNEHRELLRMRRE